MATDCFVNRTLKRNIKAEISLPEREEGGCFTLHADGKMHQIITGVSTSQCEVLYSVMYTVGRLQPSKLT